MDIEIKADEPSSIREPISNAEVEALSASLLSGEFVEKVQDHLDPGFKALRLKDRQVSEP